MRYHFSFLSINNKPESMLDMMYHFIPGFNLFFEKYASSYYEMEKAYYDKNGDYIIKYGLTDTEAGSQIALHFSQLINNISRILKLSPEDVIHPPKLSKIYISKKWFSNGINRNYFSNYSISSFDFKSETQRLISERFEKPKVISDFYSIIFMNPLFINAGQPIYKSDSKIGKLYSLYRKEEDILRRVFIFNTLSSLVSSLYVEKSLVDAGKLDKIHFEDIYKVSTEELDESLEDSINNIISIMKEHNVKTFSKNLLFFPDTYSENNITNLYANIKQQNTKETLTELLDLNFLMLGKAYVIAKDKHSFIFNYKNDKSKYTASLGIKIPNKKQAYSIDYFESDFMPNFYKKAMYEMSLFESWKDRVRYIGKLFHDIWYNKLPLLDYLISIKPGHDVNAYSKTFLDTKRGKIILFNSLRLEKNYTFIVEDKRDLFTRPEDTELIFSQYNHDKKDYFPSTAFYLTMLANPDSSLMKLFKNSLFYDIPKEYRSSAEQIIYKIEQGKFTESLINELEAIKLNK
jgi:hypothetical protein